MTSRSFMLLADDTKKSNVVPLIPLYVGATLAIRAKDEQNVNVHFDFKFIVLLIRSAEHSLQQHKY